MGFFDMFRKPAPATAPAASAFTGQLGAQPAPVEFTEQSLQNDPSALGKLIAEGFQHGNVQVMGDLTSITAEQKAKLAKYGIDLDALTTAAIASPMPFAAHVDDHISQLERLTALHQAGTLTDAELEAEKKKILG